MKFTGFLLVLFVFQGLCALFFVSDILATVLGLRDTPMSWHLRELLELAAAVGLLTGFALGWLALRHQLSRSRRAEKSLRVVRGEFLDHLEREFDAWGLTPAERDVALFSLKGFSTQEIGELRATSEGTVKAQTNAIYRKAGVSGRSQLLSLFMEDFIGKADVTQEVRDDPEAAASRASS